ncbi:MAG: hypothetical protein EAX81_01845 [Candidatus Thorarchaeota archaeon]|nr:hypothetical protein [Candidatus Thorarchaeota archaeon]
MRLSNGRLDSQIIGWIKWFMFIVTVVFPFGIFPNLYFIGISTTQSADIVVLSYLWAFIPSFSEKVILLDLPWMIYGLAGGFVNIFFALNVIRYCEDRISWDELLWTGLLTLSIPFLSLALLIPTMISTGVFAYLGPIPIQLVIGLWIAKRAGDIHLHSPN